jgi:hypothetical protein
LGTIVERLGNPTSGIYENGEMRYARNAWSLVFFDNRIFVGAGNSNNHGPATNAGPVPLFTWDTVRSGLVKEYDVKDEQVDLLRVLPSGANGAQELWIPGHDSHPEGIAQKATDWAAGNVYRRKASGFGWDMMRTVRNGIHVYDIAWFKGKLFVGLANVLGGFVARSEDRGLSWHEMAAAICPCARVRTLFAIAGTLYASSNGPNGNGRIFSWDGAKAMTAEKHTFFPGLKPDECFVARPTPLGAFETATEIAYIAAVSQIDHDWSPAGLFRVGDDLAATPISLPGKALPRDLLFSGGQLYVLAQTGEGARRTTHVFAIAGKTAPQEILRFERGTFARSFALAPNGDFYFGMGCEPTDLKDESGELLRVRANGRK